MLIEVPPTNRHEDTTKTAITLSKINENSVPKEIETQVDMSNSSTSDIDSKQESNGTDGPEKNGVINGNISSSLNAPIQKQSETSAATPPPLSQYPSQYSHLPPQHHQQHPAYIQQFQNYYSYSMPTNTPSDQANSPGPGSSGFEAQAAYHQQQAAFFDRSYGSTNLPQLPLTPSSNSNTVVGIEALGVGPTSPNFPNPRFGGATMEQIDPAVLNRNSLAAPPSPGLGMTRGYMNNAQGLPPASPAIPGYGGVYQAYMNPRMTGGDDRHVTLSPQPTWTETSIQHQMYQQALTSPQFSSMPYATNNMQRATANASEPPRTQSFEEMLPPSALSSSESFDQNPHYQPNMGGGGSTIRNGTLFAHPQPWGFPSSEIYPSGMNANPHSAHIMPVTPAYSTSDGSPPGEGLLSHHTQSRHPKGVGMRGRDPHSHLYYQHTATTPGPPIQTTTSNKGPDGANLFIFHIPNHFTNVDMFKLFCSYGNLLSVRIMVEKDTGRSRGFGFVSYDTPESAATAIKELNGFVIGNKRLKVQHKQIKSSDHNNSSTNSSNGVTTLFFGGHQEQNELESVDGVKGISKDQHQGLNAEPLDTEENNLVVASENGMNDGALGNYDAIRKALPES